MFPYQNIKNLKKAIFWDVARVDIVLTDVSEERIASIFRVEEKENPRTRNQLEQVLIDLTLFCQHLLTLVPCSWIFIIITAIKTSNLTLKNWLEHVLMDRHTI
jgi:hypothetical protein